jgi:Domain of unknown function (DUF4189)
MGRVGSRPFVTAVALGLIAVALLPGPAVAEGALAIGLPNDVTKDGIALGWNTNSPTAAEARQRALAGCRDVKNSTDAARSLCTIVGTFHNQCVAGAEDPDPGTPGVGWAVATDKKTAEQQALAMCQAKSPPARRAACKVMTSGCDGSAK